MELRTLASGSSGNCILVSHNGAHLLVDAGISCRRIVAALRSLAIEPEHLLGVCITHELCPAGLHQPRHRPTALLPDGGAGGAGAPPDSRGGGGGRRL